MVLDATYMPWIRRLRKHIKDYEDDNVLTEAEENDDEDLQYAIEDALNKISNAYMPKMAYAVSDVNDSVPWFLVRDCATLDILKSNIMKSARNQHSYNDSGGVQIRDEDVYGRYSNVLNMLSNTFQHELKSFKASVNLDSCYGGVSSEFSLVYESEGNTNQ